MTPKIEEAWAKFWFDCKGLTWPKDTFTAGYQSALPQWQDISTAPKSGDILGYCLKTDEQFVVWWGEQVETGHGGWVAFRNADGLCVLIKDLSHWMPLPIPPKEGEG